MSSPNFELQKAVYAALAANSTLTALLANGVNSIMDNPIGNEAKPYVHIGEFDQRDNSTKSFIGGDHLLTLHVWSGERGKKEVSDIMQQIKASLNRQSLSVTGNQLIDLMFDSDRVFLDADGLTQHGITEYKALTIES